MPERGGNSQRDEVGVADEAAPPERGVELDERPQLRLVAPHPREDHRDAPRLPRRRRSRRPVEPPAAAGPHGLRPPARPPQRPLRYFRRGEANRSKGLRCSTPLLVAMEVGEGEARDGDGDGDGDGVGRLLAPFGVWFVADFYFPFFLFYFAWIY